MTSAPEIFDADARRQRRARAARRSTEAFLHRRCVDDVVERLRDINRQFQNALIIAPPGFWNHVLKALPEDKHPAQCTFVYDAEGLTPPLITASDDNLPFDVDRFDLVISILSLHSVNDLPGALMNAAHILAPDGLFLAAYFGGETLSELRQSLYRVESAVSGGLTPRVFPMIDFSQSASLLQRAGFALPVIDTDRFTLSYDRLGKLLADLRDAGETNCLRDRNKYPLNRTFFKMLEGDLLETTPAKTGRFAISFEILWATGWTPHKSQQKPLKPGSAKMRLSEALGVKEQKL